MKYWSTMSNSQFGRNSGLYNKQQKVVVKVWISPYKYQMVSWDIPKQLNTGVSIGYLYDNIKLLLNCDQIYSEFSNQTMFCPAEYDGLMEFEMSTYPKKWVTQTVSCKRCS